MTTNLVKVKLKWVGSGCGSVGRAVASDTRGPRFESSHRQKFIYILNICLLSTVFWKDENKEKEAGNGPFLKKKFAETFVCRVGSRYYSTAIALKCSEPCGILFKLYARVVAYKLNALTKAIFSRSLNTSQLLQWNGLNEYRTWIVWLESVEMWTRSWCHQ